MLWGKQWPQSQMWSVACFYTACELRMFFISSKLLGKNKKKNFSWYVTSIWNSIFRVHKQILVLEQTNTHCFTRYLLLLLLCNPQVESFWQRLNGPQSQNIHCLAIYRKSSEGKWPWSCPGLSFFYRFSIETSILDPKVGKISSNLGFVLTHVILL